MVTSVNLRNNWVDEMQMDRLFPSDEEPVWNECQATRVTIRPPPDCQRAWPVKNKIVNAYAHRWHGPESWSALTPTPRPQPAQPTKNKITKKSLERSPFGRWALWQPQAMFPLSRRSNASNTIQTQWNCLLHRPKKLRNPSVEWMRLFYVRRYAHQGEDDPWN